MAYYVQQFRYYGRDHANNCPANITPENLGTGLIFKNCTPIVQLGVQFAKGTSIKFYLNNSTNPIYTGYYGLYELDVTNKTTIQALHFDADEVAAKVTAETPLIIDIVYKG